MIGIRRFRNIALTTSALLAALLPVSLPSARADGGGTPVTRSVGQEPGHPIILYPGREGTAAAYCPQGTKPSGGGAAVESDPLAPVYFQESAPDPERNRWVVHAYNASGDVQTVHPRVICTTDSSINVNVGPDSSIDPGDFNSANGAGCSNTQFVVGGGVQAGPKTFVMWSDWSTVRSWTAGAKYTDFSPDAPLSYVRAFAICSDTQPTLRVSTVSVAAGGVGTAHAECPAGQVPTGGGADIGLDALLNGSGPTATGWTAQGTNHSDGPRNLEASVFCTTP
ncbi:hypothetical protein CG736_15035 [Kitasatospora sp. CB02891]|nr:hypothetical protein CG736_15035 [Kitasatospora sp. CB02891]